MSDINKAILKVAQQNPEFAKALTAELHKTARLDVEEDINKMWSQANAAGYDLINKARAMRAKAIANLQQRGFRPIEMSVRKVVNDTDDFDFVDMDIKSVEEDNYGDKSFVTSLTLTVRTIVDPDYFRSGAEWKRDIEKLAKSIGIEPKAIKQIAPVKWVISAKWSKWLI